MSPFVSCPIIRKNGNIHYVKIDIEDLELFEKYTWCVKRWKNSRTFYVYRLFDLNGVRKCKLLHREVMGHYNFSTKLVIDHKNHDGLDNRKTNLRPCSQRLNSCNHQVYKSNKSGVSGVSWSKVQNKWIVRIGVNGKKINLGSFTIKEDAIKARRNAEIKYYGEYACED